MVHSDVKDIQIQRGVNRIMPKVFNTKEVDWLKQPMFFGAEPNVQRFDQQKYPIFEKLNQQQLGFFWRPEEVSLQKDRNDYHLLSEEQKQKIKDGQPWSAYQDAIDYDIAGGYNTPQKHTMTADLMTAWMREFNPELTSSFKWPTRTEYDLWENGKMTDEQFRGFYGFTFQR